MPSVRPEREGRVTAAGSAADPAAATATARFFRVLGDPTRLVLLRLLLAGPRTVSELVAATGVAQSRVSNHLACLRWCRFVEAERRGRNVVYRVADPRIGELVALGDALSAAPARASRFLPAHRAGLGLSDRPTRPPATDIQAGPGQQIPVRLVRQLCRACQAGRHARPHRGPCTLPSLACRHA